MFVSPQYLLHTVHAVAVCVGVVACTTAAFVAGAGRARDQGSGHGHPGDDVRGHVINASVARLQSDADRARDHRDANRDPSRPRRLHGKHPLHQKNRRKCRFALACRVIVVDMDELFKAL